jgi:hypothetical protein
LDGTLVQIHLPYGVAIGVAYFDFEINFPSFALFLDISNALIVKPTGNGKDSFERIGISRFVRAEKEKDPSYNVFSSARYSGVITEGVPRSEVRIV